MSRLEGVPRSELIDLTIKAAGALGEFYALRGQKYQVLFYKSVAASCVLVLVSIIVGPGWVIISPSVIFFVISVLLYYLASSDNKSQEILHKFVNVTRKDGEWVSTATILRALTVSVVSSGKGSLFLLGQTGGIPVLIKFLEMTNEKEASSIP